MQRTLALLAQLAALLLLALGTVANAADAKVDPTGTWKWTVAGRQGGEPRAYTLKLKLEGDKLTGSVTSPPRGGGDPVVTAIGDGKIKGDEISFTVTRTFNENKFVIKYLGKISGDTIKGKTETPGRDGGEATSRDWEAKRSTEK